jgi:predicted transcriptional regulator
MCTFERAMTGTTRDTLRTRQREVLDVIYRLGEASAGDVQRQLKEDVSYSAVRSVLRALEGKGLIKHRARDFRYVYSPVISRTRAARSELKRVLRSYFDDDPERLLEALLDVSSSRRYDVSYAALKRLVERARRNSG